VYSSAKLKYAMITSVQTLPNLTSNILAVDAASKYVINMIDAVGHFKGTKSSETAVEIYERSKT
jgi:hypothetical protein